MQNFFSLKRGFVYNMSYWFNKRKLPLKISVSQNLCADQRWSFCDIMNVIIDQVRGQDG